MTTKLYRMEIDSCCHCPLVEHFDSPMDDEWICSVENDRDTEPDSIPDWCPLEDVGV